MRPIRSLTTMVIGEKDYGYLVAVCNDGSIWTRVFPEARGDTWREIEAIPSHEQVVIDKIIEHARKSERESAEQITDSVTLRPVAPFSN